MVKDLGYKAAFVTQDGCVSSTIPWEGVDVLFVGGSNHHKLVESHPLIAEANARGVWVHVGRVNSAKRVMLFPTADSVDGTHFVYDASRREQERILWAVDQLSLRDSLQQPT
jgi:hypothetical protein